MRITRGQLRRIVKEEVVRLREVGEHPRSWMLRAHRAARPRFKALAASTGYKYEAPYSWGYDEETGEEHETGAVRFVAALTDDYGDWVVGLDADDNAVLHTVDDDIEMSVSELELLLADNSLDDLLEMSMDEIEELMAANDG